MTTVISDHQEPSPNLAADLLAGVAAIAAYTGLPVRTIRHMIDRHGLPAFKRGGLYFARRSSLDVYFSEGRQ